MFCSQCSEYIGENRTHCPGCGHQQKQSGGQSTATKHYCRRCKRYLKSKLCSIHGVDAVVMTQATTIGAAQPGEAEGRALPMPGAANANQQSWRSSGPKKAPRRPRPQKTDYPSPDGTMNMPFGAPPVAETPVFNDDVRAPWDQPAEPSAFTDDVRAPWDQPQPQAEPVNPQPAVKAKKTAKNESKKEPKVADWQVAVKAHLELFKAMIEKQWAALLKKRGERRAERQKNVAAKAKQAPQQPLLKGASTTKPAEAAKKATKPAKKQVKTKQSAAQFSWAFATLVFLTLAGTGAIVVKEFYPEYAKNTLFAEAETHYSEGQHQEAWLLYQEYKNKYPNDAAIAGIEARMEQIQQISEEVRQRDIELYALMEKAATAYNEKRYLTPKSNNSLFFISQILEINPAFSPALELKNRLIGQYFQNAEKAFDEDRYDDAIAAFQHILEIKPGDAEILAQIDNTLKVKNVNDMLKNLGELAQAKEEVKKLRKEKYKLKIQVKQERRKLKEIATADKTRSFSKVKPQLPATENLLPGKSSLSDIVASLPENSKLEKPQERKEKGLIAATKKVPQPAPKFSSDDTSADIGLGEALGIQLIADEDDENAAKLVEETLIDGGKKEYLHREKPSLPKGVENSEVTMILAECIVGIDGSVEKVNLVSPADDHQLNQIALSSFKKYQFKPATHNGDPVRFKSIEVISF